MKRSQYTDYVIDYYNRIGTTKGCLSLEQFTKLNKEKAVEWWNNELSVWDRDELIIKHYGMLEPGKIGNKEIETMWEKEIQSRV